MSSIVDPVSAPLPTETTRQQLLREAQRLLQTRGYDSFSFQDLADRVGIRKASVHSHFKNKAELGEKLAAQYLEEFEAWCKHAELRSPVDQLRSFTRVLRKVTLESNSVCANSAFFADWESLPESVRVKVRLLQDRQVTWIGQRIFAARAAGTLRFEGDAALRARQFFILVVGTLQAARAWKDPQIFEALVLTFLLDLGLSPAHHSA